MFILRPVSSTAISKLSFDKEKGILSVSFVGGGHYWYFGVEENQVDDIVNKAMTAKEDGLPSVGATFYHTVREDNPFLKV